MTLRRILVFPAYAGMSPSVFPSLASHLRFPRLRGDEPGLTFMTVVAVVFSPLTRG